MYLKTAKARRSGFTLVEILVVTFIVTIVSLGISNIFVVGKRAWFIGSTQIAVQEAARNAMHRMTQELTFSSPLQSDIGLDGDAITFCKPESVDGSGNITWSAPIQYSLNEGQILRTVDSQINVLANDISVLQFSPLGSRSIEVVVSAQKNTIDGRNIEYSLKSQVYLRNE